MKPQVIIKEKDDGKISSYFLIEPETGKVLWDGAKKICRHSYIKAQGIGGGRIFLYCNKCGKTKSVNVG